MPAYLPLLARMYLLPFVTRVRDCVLVCVRACLCACVSACVRVCVRACTRVRCSAGHHPGRLGEQAPAADGGSDVPADGRDLGPVPPVHAGPHDALRHPWGHRHQRALPCPGLPRGWGRPGALQRRLLLQPNGLLFPRCVYVCVLRAWRQRSPVCVCGCAACLEATGSVRRAYGPKCTLRGAKQRLTVCYVRVWETIWIVGHETPATN